jgi:eukaryotic-like serine/threonine-protein kinase
MALQGPQKDARGVIVSDKAERLLERALSVDRERRAAFIEAGTVGDPELREELISLVNEADSANEFFERLDCAVFSSPISSDRETNAADRVHDPELSAAEMAGHYQIISLVGRGGMGAVYRAHDTRLNRDVALKFPSYAGAERDACNRLMMEARAAAALDHPNVCAIHEIGETAEGRLFIAMPFYEGETLKDLVRRGRVSLESSISAAVQIARGLTAAHNRGIVHRDVKPGNIIVGSDGTVRLLDFGLAMPIDDSLAKSGVTPGTVAYMSPEHARGEAVDKRSDLWSLGVVLYEMLAGVRPFRGASAHETLGAILHMDPEPLAQWNPTIPPALESVTLRLLQKNPANRYQDGAEVLNDLQQVASSSARAMQKSRARKIREVSAVGALLLVAVAGMTIRPRSPATMRGQAQRVPTRNVAAYELYKRGTDPVLLRSDSGARVAMAALEQAIALDANYGAAYSGIARLHLRVGFGGSDLQMSRRERLALAEEAALRGVTLDSMAGDAHVSLALVRRSNYEMNSAEAEMLKAAAIEPTSSLVHEKLASLYVLTGRPADGLSEARRAVEIDPLSPAARAEIANALMASSRCDEALLELARLRSLRPPILRAGAIASQCYAHKQMWREAVAEARRISTNGGPRGQAILGYVLGRSGQCKEARELLDALIDRSKRTHGDAFDVAIVYAGLGDMDRAFAWLARSVDDRSFGFDWLGVIEAELRRDSRFMGIARRAGLSASE